MTTTTTANPSRPQRNVPKQRKKAGSGQRDEGEYSDYYGCGPGLLHVNSERFELRGASGHAKVATVSSGEGQKDRKFAIECRHGDIAGRMDSGASDHIFKNRKFANDTKDSSAVIGTASEKGKVGMVKKKKDFCSTARGRALTIWLIT